MMNLNQIASTIAAVSDLPAFILTGEKIEVVRMGYLSRVKLNVLYKILFNKLFVNLSLRKVLKLPVLIRFINSLEFSTAVVILSANPITTIVLGPFFQDDINLEKIIDKLVQNENFEISYQEASDLVHSIVVKDSMFIQALGKTVYSLIKTSNDSYVEIKTIRESGTAKEEVQTISENRIKGTEIDSYYSYDRELRRLVKSGDKARLKQLLVPKTEEETRKARALSLVGENRNPPQGIKDERKLAVILNTLFRSSADDAGLPPVYIHSISEEVAAEIERAKTTEDLLEAIDFMIEKYCNSINQMELQNHSVNIVKVQRYILNNIDKKITLSDLSQLTGLDGSYLCRLFKRECHTTINEYIQAHRIAEAKVMLEKTDSPISEIAELLGFKSQSYFCSAFKNAVGISPTKYKKNQGQFYKPENA